MAVLAFGGLGYLAPHALRTRIERTVRDRCARVPGAVCTLRRVDFAVDGVLLEGFAMRSRGEILTVTADRVALRINWLSALLQRRQDVDVRVDGLRVIAHGSPVDIADIVHEARPVHTTATRGTVRITRATVEHLSVDLSPSPGNDLPLYARLDGASLQWERGHEAALRWTVGELHDGPIESVETHRCSVLRAADGLLSIDCAEHTATVDVATLPADVAALSRVWTALRHPDGNASQTEPPRVDGAQEFQGIDARSHGGRITLRHGEDTLADLSPTVLSVVVDAHHAVDLQLRVGGDRVGTPSLALDVMDDANGWRVDLDGEGLPLAQLAPWVPMVPWHNVEAGVARTHVRVRPEPAGVVRIEGGASVENFGLAHNGLAHDPIDGLAVELDGSVLVDTLRRRITSPGITVHVNGIPMTFAGWVERSARMLAIDASVRVPDVSCDDIRRSLPREVTGPLAGFEFTGTLGGDAHLALDTARLSDTLLAFDIRNDCAVNRQNSEVALERFTRPFVQRVEEPGGTVRAFVTGPGAPAWVSLENVSPLVAAAVVNREDGGFYRHRGFSPDQIRGALVRDVGAGRFAYGASTLSMQLVKNVFLAREKTLVRKFQEVALTWWVEQRLDKRSILELYLNVVEFGPGIYGIGPAARYFFGRQPAELTPLQAIYLATLLPAPTPRYVNFERGGLTPEGLNRLRAIARSMGANHALTPAEVTEAEGEVLTFRPAQAVVPGALTLNVDPSTTDGQAADIAEAQPTVVTAPDDGDTPTEPPGDSPAAGEATTDDARDGNQAPATEPSAPR